MYSVQDERLDLLKRKSSSVYIVESDNDSLFLGCVIQAHKQFSQMVEKLFFCFLFFSTLLLLYRQGKREKQNGGQHQQSY